MTGIKIEDAKPMTATAIASKAELPEVNTDPGTAYIVTEDGTRKLIVREPVVVQGEYTVFELTKQLDKMLGDRDRLDDMIAKHEALLALFPAE